MQNGDYACPSYARGQFAAGSWFGTSVVMSELRTRAVC